MKRYYWRRPRLLPKALLAAFLLSAVFVRGQDPDSSKKKDEPPLPTKKSKDEDPPLPSKKPPAAKQVRVQVTAASAEVQTGDKVIATVSKGQVLPFTKKTEDYYLVIVKGMKGWIKREEVREIEVTVGGEIPHGPAPAQIDPETTRKVKQATVYVRVRLANDNTLEGSGFFAAQPGLILTNAHVLGMRSPGSPKPAQVSVVVHSGEPEEFTLPAEILGVDRENDLGVVRVKAEASRLPAPLPVDSTQNLNLLHKVYIFGFPFGKSLGKNITVSESSVSSIRKDADGSATQVQVNGGMHPGNSGGPVVDSRGVVVGVSVSMIRGTQINFAVPGERVLELLRGRVAETQFGEAFIEKDQAKLPLRLDSLDPLGRIRTLKLEVWAGTASPARPLTLVQPKPLPGDGKKQIIAVNYKNNSAQVDIPMPALGDGQVFWIQPVVTDNSGATHWARAIAYKPSEFPPLERKAAVLQQQFDRQPQRTIKLMGSFQAQISKGPNQLLIRDIMEMEALETARSEPRGGQLHLFLGAKKFTTEVNGKTIPLFPRAQGFLQGRNMTFILDAQGALLQRTVPVLNFPNPIDLRLDFEDLVHLIANTYEMTCLSVPNRELQALQTWQARVPLILTNQGQGKKTQIVDMFLTCTYEGRRLHKGDNHAVISLRGIVKGREPGKRSTAGLVTGKAHFALDKGYLSFAKMRVESESSEGDLTVVHSLDLSMTRVPGNTAGIIATPVAPVRGPVEKGRAIVQAQMALTVKDPVNCPGKPGCFYKLQPVNFEAGKTYIIEMDKVGATPLDPYLVLVNPQGQIVAQDDDSGGNLNARIIYKAPQAGMYRVYATALVPKMTGAFRLTVSEEAALIPAGTPPEYALAIPHLQKRDFDKAIPHLEKAIAKDPKLIKAQIDLAFAYNEKRLYDKAIACLKKVIELEPNNVVAHNNLGVAYNGKGLFDEAIPCFKKAIELDPNHATALTNLGFAYNAKRQYDQAIQCLKKAIDLEPNRLLAHNNLGNAYNGKGLHDQAIGCFKKVIELDPRVAAAHNALGFTYNAMGLFDRAIPSFQKAIELEPNFVIAHNNLGFAYNAQGFYDQGIPCLKRAVQLAPKHAIAQNNLGMALGEAGDLQAARHALKEALDLIPQNAPQFKAWKDSFEKMEALLALEPRLADIVKGIRKPKDFQERMMFGKLCRVKQHYSSALRFYELALAGDPEAAKKLSPVDHLVLARTAVLASAGKGIDPPPQAERPKYRAKAIASLRKFMMTQEQALQKDFKANRASCQKNIRALLQHRDFALVRQAALNDLPEGERREWESFWGEVDDLLQKADATS